MAVGMIVCMTSDIDPPKLAAARVLAIAMQKGGVSKTTTAVNVATALADLGYRVLVIDMDQQAHCTMSLRVDLGPDDASLYEVLHPDRALRVPLRNVIKRSEFGVDVAPAHMALRELKRTGLGSGGQLRLARELDSVIDDYDFVLLDCPPALGELTTAALAAADDVLAVLKPGGFEVSSMRELANTILDVQETLNADIEIRYVLLADFDGRNQAGKDVRNQLRADWGAWDSGGVYLGEVPHTVRVVEAANKRMPIHVHAPACTAAVAYQEVAERVAKRVKAAA